MFVESFRKPFSQFFASDGGMLTEEAGEMTAGVPELVFPPEHALSRLQARWSGCEQPPLRLSLFPAGQSVPLVSRQSAASEAEALRDALTRAAAARQRAMCGRGDAAPPDLDEQAVIHLSRDEMIAWLLLFPPVGRGRALTLLQILQLLAGSGVSNGMDLPLLKRLPTMEDRYFRLFPVAFGTAPVCGEDGRVIDHCSRMPVVPNVGEKLDHADYVSLNLVRDIREGEVICELIPPTSGIPGNTVTGKPLPARAGAKPAVPRGRNTALTGDGRYLVAARKGHVEFLAPNFQVKPVLEIEEDVDHANGGIHFLGDVHIHGDVCNGATVRAMGNVQVDGVIEACTIEAGEHIIVSSGVQGQDRAVLRAHKSVFAKYLEHCCVYARESVQADCIIDCEIYSNGVVRACTGRGVIIGGTIRSAAEVSASMVGSRAERLTSIVLGGLPCEESERLQMLAEIEEADRMRKEWEALPDSAAKQSELSKIRLNLCIAKMKLEKFDKELRERAVAALEHDHRRLISGALYPGTVVTIGRTSYRVNRVETDCVIGVTEGLVGRL